MSLQKFRGAIQTLHSRIKQVSYAKCLFYPDVLPILYNLSGHHYFREAYVDDLMSFEISETAVHTRLFSDGSLMFALESVECILLLSLIHI